MSVADPSADAEFEQRFARIEPLLAELSHSTDPALERVTREVLATVLELHQRGLARVLTIAAREDSVREALARDARVSAMLLLHGLHPLSLEERVSRAVATLRDRYRSKIETVAFDVTSGGAISVRVQPTASCCGSTRAVLNKDFEDALIAAVPDAESLQVQLTEAGPALVKLRRNSSDNANQSVGGSR